MTLKKKKILFVIDSLLIGGAERSLITLLSMLDYDKYNVDLQLFATCGQFTEQVPSKVSVLPNLPHVDFLQKSKLKRLLSFNIPLLISSYKFSYSIRIKQYIASDISRLYWKYFSPHIKISSKQYDVAIGYGQGVPTMYVADKVNSKNKLAWINTCYSPKAKTKKFLSNIYSKIDTVVAVSNGAKRIFASSFPECASKTMVIMDIINPDIINDWAKAKPKISFDKTKPIILTLSRLDSNTKGMDLTLKTAKHLRDKGFNFAWHIFGDGNYRATMEKYIEENRLEDYVSLHNAVTNPYPYLSNAKLYVQTSREEGFGLSIAEARLLNVPVVTTPFKNVENQIIHGKNGLISTMNPNDISDTIISILTNQELYSSIQSYLHTEKKGNTEELSKLTAIFDN